MMAFFILHIGLIFFNELNTIMHILFSIVLMKNSSGQNRTFLSWTYYLRYVGRMLQCQNSCNIVIKMNYLVPKIVDIGTVK